MNARSDKRNIEDVFKFRVKSLRLKKKLKLTQVANDVGITKGTYAGYESGAKFPSIGTLERLAERLGTSADYLVGRTDNPVPINFRSDDNDKFNWDGEPLTQEQLQILENLLKTMLEQNQNETKNVR